jgi:hypothetical protein
VNHFLKEHSNSKYSHSFESNHFSLKEITIIGRVNSSGLIDKKKCMENFIQLRKEIALKVTDTSKVPEKMKKTIVLNM